MLDRKYIGITFPFSLLTTSRLRRGEATVDPGNLVPIVVLRCLQTALN